MADIEKIKEMEDMAIQATGASQLVREVVDITRDYSEKGTVLIVYDGKKREHSLVLRRPSGIKEDLERGESYDRFLEFILNGLFK